MAKKKIQTQKAISPKTYLKSGKARKLPISHVLISSDWEEARKCIVMIGRQHISGNVTYAVLLLDMLCCGVKDAFYRVNESYFGFEDLKRKYATDFGSEFISLDYNYAHNLIFAAHDFAADYGIEPHADFQYAKMILEEDDDRVPLIDVEVGLDGVPALDVYDADARTAYYIRQLEKHAGKGNYILLNEDMETEEPFQQDDLDKYTYEDWERVLLQTPMDDFEVMNHTIGFLFHECVYLPTIENDPLKQEILQLSERVTDEPIIDEHLSDEENEYIEEYHSYLIEGDITAIEKSVKPLKGLIKKYPQNPILYNYLKNFYVLLNERQKARRVLNETIQRFPDYFFAKVSHFDELVVNDNIQDAEEFLKENGSITDWFKADERIHVSQWSPFCKIMVRYFIAKDDFMRAYCFLDEMKLERENLNKYYMPFLSFIYENVVEFLTELRNGQHNLNDVIKRLMEASAD